MCCEYEAIIKSVAELVVMGPWDVKELLGLLIVKVSSGCFFYPRFSVLAEHAEHLRKTSLVHASLRGFQTSTQKQAGRETHKNSTKTYKNTITIQTNQQGQTLGSQVHHQNHQPNPHQTNTQHRTSAGPTKRLPPR